jgi:hypothetical protein
MAGTVVRLGWSDPLTDTFGTHPLLGAALDLNDGQTYTLLSPQGLGLNAPQQTLISTGNVRTQGETITRAIYRHNRQAKMQLALGPAASYAEFVAAIRALLRWLNAAPATPIAVQWQPFGASESGYLDVVGATHNIPSGAWEHDAAQIYPSGPTTSSGAARVDFPPGGTVNCYWRPYAGGSPTGHLGAITVAAGDTLGIRARVKSSGLSGDAVVQFWINEYDASGSYLRTAGITGATPNAGWATLLGLYSESGLCDGGKLRLCRPGAVMPGYRRVRE